MTTGLCVRCGKCPKMQRMLFCYVCSYQVVTRVTSVLNLDALTRMTASEVRMRQEIFIKHHGL